MKKYDLIVVGSGVGLTVLGQALGAGKKVALIEDAKMGGTCLTRGCIPSKVLVYPADIIREAQHAKKVGLDIKIGNIDWELITKRVWSQIDESKGIEHGLSKASKLTVYKGIGEFIGKYEMRVKLNETGEYSDVFSGEKIVLASGGRTFIPPIKGIEEVGYVTSKSFFGEKFPKKPWKSLIIIGGGVIAAEFAHIFSAMGTKVTIIEMLPRLVPTEEPEISEILTRKFGEFLTVSTGAKAVSTRVENGNKVVQVEFVKSGKRTEYSAEEIFVAAGRRSNADWLKVEKTGVEIDEKGWIKTNSFTETNVPNIWAIGDANGKYQFRHKANHDAEICVKNIYGSGEKREVDYSAVPWAIFTYPQIAHVGLTQQEAMNKGYKILVAVKMYSSVAKGFAMGLGDGDDGLFKLIVDQSYRILGAHAIGPHAALLIQQIVYLMNSGFTCENTGDKYSYMLPKASNACPEGGSFMPIYKSMVIHPSLNEVVGWAIGNLKPVGKKSHHGHGH
jgi:mycothione reductase